MPMQFEIIVASQVVAGDVIDVLTSSLPGRYWVWREVADVRMGPNQNIILTVYVDLYRGLTREQHMSPTAPVKVLREQIPYKELFQIDIDGNQLY